MLVELAMFLQLADACQRTVEPTTLAALARTESRFESWALLDNDTRTSLKPATLAEAIATATRLVGAGHSVDIGLMQVNSRNLPRLGISIAQALDPCTSIAAGAKILADGYAGGGTDEAQQANLRVALSRYNTGSPDRGFSNGYVQKVEGSAAYLVPALRVSPGQAAVAAALPRGPSPAPAPVAPAKSRGWDVWAEAEEGTPSGTASWDASPDMRSTAIAASAPAAVPAPHPDPAPAPTARVVMLQPVQPSEGP